MVLHSAVQYFDADGELFGPLVITSLPVGVRANYCNVHVCMTVCLYICPIAYLTSSSAIAERPRDARVTSIRKITKWNF